jgi:hypothetical protein
MASTDKPKRTRARMVLLSIVGACALGAAAILPIGATAQVSVDVIIGTPPPPVRVEVVPAPRPGYVWAPGYWVWEGHRHVWREGYWETERPGERFVPAAWVNTPGGWRFVPAHWEHHEREFCPPGQAKKGRC